MKNELVGYLNKKAKEAGYEYACPNCGNTSHLRIAVRAMAKLYQDPIEQIFETDTYGDLEFERGDYMECGSCDYEGTVSDFELYRKKENDDADQ